MKPTEGVWEAEHCLDCVPPINGKSEFWCVSANDDDGDTGVVLCDMTSPACEQTEADAKLMAAAPDLLAALETLVRVFGNAGGRHFAEDDVQRAELAIAKAREGVSDDCSRHVQ